jgi:gliding motility-associated-like protein
LQQQSQVEIDSISGLVAGPDTIIKIGESIQLFAQGLDSLIWIPPTFLSDEFSNNPVATPLQDITYLVRPVDTSQCYPLAYVTLRVDDQSLISVPNAFTPNGDGINDYLKFYMQGIQQFIDMAIFDRWGNEVFYSTNPSVFWDGKYQGKYCEIGSYAYFIKGKTYDGREINQRGMITLIR